MLDKIDPYNVIVLYFLKLCSFTHETLVLVLLLVEFAIDRVKLPNHHRPLLNEVREEVGSRLTFWRRHHLWKRERRSFLRLLDPCQRCLQWKRYLALDAHHSASCFLKVVTIELDFTFPPHSKFIEEVRHKVTAAGGHAHRCETKSGKSVYHTCTFFSWEERWGQWENLRLSLHCVSTRIR